jgi:hypothetical protein
VVEGAQKVPARFVVPEIVSGKARAVQEELVDRRWVPALGPRAATADDDPSGRDEGDTGMRDRAVEGTHPLHCGKHGAGCAEAEDGVRLAHDRLQRRHVRGPCGGQRLVADRRRVVVHHPAATLTDLAASDLAAGRAVEDAHEVLVEPGPGEGTSPVHPVLDLEHLVADRPPPERGDELLRARGLPSPVSEAEGPQPASDGLDEAVEQRRART